MLESKKVTATGRKHKYVKIKQEVSQNQTGFNTHFSTLRKAAPGRLTNAWYNGTDADLVYENLELDKNWTKKII